MTRRPLMTLAACIAIALAGACGGGGDDGSDAAAGPGTGRADLAGGKAAEDAALALAKCMRENGIDMPDPGSGGGGFVVIGPDDENAPTEEEMEKAEAACKDERQAMRGAIGEPPADLQDKMLAMARCMRGKGIDMPDPEVSEGRARVSLDPDQVNDPEFKEAQAACRKEAGLPEPGRRGVVPGR